MMSSVDGRLITDRYSLPFDGKNQDDVVNRYFEVEAELGGQAILIGRQTVQRHIFTGTFSDDNAADTPTTDLNPFISPALGSRPTVVFDSRGKIRYDKAQMGHDTFIAVLGECVSQAYLEHLRAHGVSYLFAGSDGKNLPLAMKTLHEIFGIQRALLEGGGILNGSFLKAGLIDELSLVIYPGIDGLKGVPAIFEYAGSPDEFPARGQSLEFLSAKQFPDGIIQLRYKFHKKQ